MRRYIISSVREEFYKSKVENSIVLGNHVLFFDADGLIINLEKVLSSLYTNTRNNTLPRRSYTETARISGVTFDEALIAFDRAVSQSSSSASASSNNDVELEREERTPRSATPPSLVIAQQTEEEEELGSKTIKSTSQICTIYQTSRWNSGKGNTLNSVIRYQGLAILVSRYDVNAAVVAFAWTSSNFSILSSYETRRLERSDMLSVIRGMAESFIAEDLLPRKFESFGRTL